MFWLLALNPLGLVALVFAARGLWGGQSRFLALGLTRRSSRPAFGGRLSLFVSLRKTRIIQAHALFTGISLLKRLSVGFFAVCRASPWGFAPFQAFLASSPCAASAISYHFASISSLPWRSAFSRFAPVVNFGFPVLSSGSNCAVKPTRLRRSAYFRSLCAISHRRNPIKQ